MAATSGLPLAANQPAALRLEPPVGEARARRGDLIGESAVHAAVKRSAARRAQSDLARAASLAKSDMGDAEYERLRVQSRPFGTSEASDLLPSR